MQGARGGYTIIEVLIVLAVSGALFLSAVTVFQGKQGRTEFSQAMRDLESKVNSFVSDTSVNALPGNGQYSCKVNSGLPVLTSSKGPNNTSGTNDECIFLGRALQVVNNGGNGRIFAYGVLSQRVDYTTAPPTEVTTLAQAKPEPAMGPPFAPPGSPSLTEQYDLLAGSTFISAKISTNSSPPPSNAQEVDLVGYYNSPQAVSASGNPILTTLGYTPSFTSNPASPTSNIQITIRANSGSLVQTWYLCIQSGSSNEIAELAITSSTAGISTKINYGICS